MFVLSTLKKVLNNNKGQQDGNGQSIDENQVIEASQVDSEYTSLHIRKMTYNEACGSIHNSNNKRTEYLSPSPSFSNLDSTASDTIYNQSTNSIRQLTPARELTPEYISSKPIVYTPTFDDDLPDLEEWELSKLARGAKWDRNRRKSRGHYI